MNDNDYIVLCSEVKVGTNNLARVRNFRANRNLNPHTKSDNIEHS